MGQDRIKQRRIELHKMLIDLLGSKNVYFQPPESIKMKYPCIIYKLDNINTTYADDMPYLHKRRYSITVIDRDPDSVIRDKVTHLKTSNFERAYVSDNLYHSVFNIFY